MRRGDKTPDDLDRPEGNDLETNYEKHDVGEAEVVARLEEDDYEVEAWGIDMRGDDGEDGIIYDDKMDLRVYDNGDLVGLIDVKTKSGPSYMGQFNERHYVKYHEHSTDLGVPTFVVMMQVDYSENRVDDEFVFEIDGDLYDGVMASSEDDAVGTFPDGNHKVVVEHDERADWRTLRQRLAHKSMEEE